MEGILVAVSQVVVFAWWVHDAQTLPIFSTARLNRAVSSEEVDEWCCWSVLIVHEKAQNHGNLSEVLMSLIWQSTLSKPHQLLDGGL